MKIKMHFEMTHLDRNGKTKFVFQKSCDSFNYNFMRYLGASFKAAVVENVIDTGNVSRAVSYAGILNTLALPGVTTYGLRVGTVGTASAPADYNLGGLISHGVGDGMLAYGGVSIPDPDIVGSVISLHAKRTFINGGSTDITLRELDLVSNTGGFNVEFLRDAFADQVIPALDGITVDVVMQVTV
jgi:hypothetical protein